MKRLCFLSFLLCTVLTLSASISHATYKGKIGPYGVEFVFAHVSGMGNGAQYRYLTITYHLCNNNVIILFWENGTVFFSQNGKSKPSPFPVTFP